jgi:kinesin family protein C2/C3
LTPWRTPAKLEPKRFTFDKVFGPTTSQAQLFEELRPTVESVLDGFNATVLSYGWVSRTR